jgi:flagellar hook assembly protein FlgD
VGNSLRVEIDTEKLQPVTVTVFNSKGERVRNLFEGDMAAGVHYVDWDGKDGSQNTVVPGDYTVVLELDGKKMSKILKVLPGP